MPKPRRIQVDPELLKEVEEFERRIREDKAENAVVIKRAEETLERIQRKLARR